MQHYSDVVQDQRGNVQPNVSITVKLNGSTATVYSDNGTTTKANPLTTNSDGEFDFYAANGVYTFWVDGAQVGSATLFDLVNVSSYGAVGDGVTDDSAACQLAIDRVRALVSTVASNSVGISLLIPPGKYKIGTGLDFTGIRSFGVTIQADGATLYGCCTGKPVLDMFYSRFVHVVGLTIVGDTTNVPKYGIQYGRKDSTVSDCNYFTNVSIVGRFSGACMYNHGSETSQHDHIRLFNDYNDASVPALIMDGANNFSAASDFVTVTSSAGVDVSFNENNFIGCDIRKSTTGPAVIYSGAPARHTWIGGYAVTYDDWAFRFYKVSGINQMTLDVHVETTGANGFLLVDNVNPSANVFLRGLKIRDHNPQVDTAIIDTTGTTRTVLLDAAEFEFAACPSGVPLFGATSGSADKILFSGDIRWEDADTLDLSNARVTGRVYTESVTTITHAAGTYQVIRRPSSADTRALEFKGETRFSGTRDGSDASDYLSLTGSGAGGIPEILAGGTDTNIDVRITPKGTGRVRFGTRSSTSDVAITGYIEVKDSAGTTRKLAVID